MRRIFLLGLLLASLAPAAHGQLVIQGVQGNIKEQLQSQLVRLDDCHVGEARARAVGRDSLSEARNILRALGYYQAELSQQLKTDDQGCRYIQLQIDKGPPTRIIDIEIRMEGQAQDDPEMRQLLKDLPFKRGDRLVHADYEAYKSRLERLAKRRGYYDGQFSLKQIRVDAEASEARILLHYDSGARYRYGETRIAEAGLSEDFVRRYLPYEAGDPVDSADLTELQQRLIDSQYFAVVSVRPAIDSRSGGKVDVKVDLKPVKPWRVSAGLGIDTNAGPRLSLAAENRRLNERGDRVGADLSLSPKVKQLQLRHRRPLKNPTREYRQIQFGATQERTDSSSSTGYSLGWSRIKSLDSGWIRTLGVSYQRENSLIAGDEISSQLMLPSMSWQKTHKRGDRRIHSGWRLGVDFSFAVRNLLSDISLAQTEAEAKHIMSLGPGRFISRVQAGATWVEEFAEVPASIRYFAGGDNSVRGYDFESLGPTNAEGRAIGGRNLLVGSLEYDIPIVGNWDVALFVDAGDAFNDEPDFKQSYGAGIRWHSMVGTIRLDVAFPVQGDGARLHIFMGPEL